MYEVESKVEIGQVVPISSHPIQHNVMHDVNITFMMTAMIFQKNCSIAGHMLCLH